EKWVESSVGTIHTFQGRQADGVILVLGASASNQGALKFASESPNILNVALTRAKDFLLVVGNHEVWSKQRNFSLVAKRLAVIHPAEETV
ncbi:MAG: AAA domain-containing protein, partial [Bacteroidota bacterium]